MPSIESSMRQLVGIRGVSGDDALSLSSGLVGYGFEVLVRDVVLGGRLRGHLVPSGLLLH